MSSVQSLRNLLEQKKGKRDHLLQQIRDTRHKVRSQRVSLQEHEQAREVIRSVGLKTQQQLQYHISDITSLALEAVYENPYTLEVEFIQRRNKTECDLFFSRNKERIDPLSAAGGGAVNIAAFALRVASWSMQRPRSNNALILDEPFGNVSQDLLPRASEMLKQVAVRLKLQIIMITHAEELAATADKTFRVKLLRGVSETEEE